MTVPGQKQERVWHDPDEPRQLQGTGFGFSLEYSAYFALLIILIRLLEGKQITIFFFMGTLIGSYLISPPIKQLIDSILEPMGKNPKE